MSGQAFAWTITSSTGSNGTIDPLGDITVEDTASQIFTITPDVGYMVNAVTVDSVSQGSIDTYTFSNVTTDHTISVTFTTLSYSVTASAGSHGSITSSGGPYTYASTPLFTITPDSGYQVANVLLDGVSIGKSTKYSFELPNYRVSGNHTIAATFETYAALSTGFVMLKWDWQTDRRVTGYKLYYGKATGDYSFYSVDVGNVNQFALTNIVLADPIYFAVTAYSVDEESGYSTELRCLAFNSTIYDPLLTIVLNYISGPNGNISGSNVQFVSVNESGSQVIATGNSGYHWLAWSDSYPTATRTDTNVTADKTVSATFAADGATPTANVSYGGFQIGGTRR